VQFLDILITLLRDLTGLCDFGSVGQTASKVLQGDPRPALAVDVRQEEPVETRVRVLRVRVAA
jgi:hypothetical protein